MKSVLLYFLLGFSIISSAQRGISGKIINTQNKPLPNATVVFPELNRETLSDSNGEYSFSNLPVGNFKISFSALGYAPKLVNVTITDNQSVINITLEETIIHMDEVIVSTVFNKMQSQNVMKVDHHKMETLRQNGATTLMEGLTKIPGVSQISTGNSIGKPVIRGLSGNRVLVYTQGIRLENQQFGEEHGLGLNDAGMESVEVIKGPASLMYGSDALGGVLYFNPEKFAKTGTYQSDISEKLFSNTLGSSSTFGFKKSDENWKFLVRGNYNTHSDYKTPDDGRVTNSRYNESDLKTGIGYNKSNFSSVLRYNYNKLNIGLPEEGSTEQSSSKEIEFPKQEISNHILSLNNNLFFRNSKLDFNMGYIFNDRNEFEESEDPALHMKLKTLNYDVKYHFPKFKNIESIVGIQGLHQTNTNFGEELLIPDAQTNDIGLFGTLFYEWKNSIIQGGIRFDNRRINTESHGTEGNEGYFAALNRNFNSFNTSLGFKTNISKNLNVRLNLASGFRAPNLAELTSNGVHEGSNRYEIGNPDLKNEQNFQTDINLEYGSTHFEFFINGFYNHIDNYIFISPTGTTIENEDVFQYTQSNAKLYGGETGIHFHPHPIDWLHFTSSFETVIGKLEDNSQLPLIPAKKWNNTIRTEFNFNKWVKETYALINIENTFAQNKISEFETSTGGYTLINLGLGGKIDLKKTNLNFTLNANNILNKTYISHLSRFKTDNIPNIGRNIILGLNLSI